ncbi:HD domain-containing protein [Madurella fahalii]|uniref:HD domain-containing protein n=1 Tax=Madurella fahalii TaxID=1157608 RepID=A0ABQ0GE49_9PEZI
MVCIRFAYLGLAASSLVSLALAKPLPWTRPDGNDRGSRRTIAGVSVIYTPVVRDAQRFAREHSDEALYKHLMRSWLFGALALRHNDTLQGLVDEEVHAVAALLHDLGFERTPGSAIVSADRRFEVDGAIASRAFLRAHPDGRRWEERRVQLVWDAIALHAESKIAYFKEPEVEAVARAIALDFSGPGLGITEPEYAAVLAEFPQDDLIENVRSTMTWLCSTKPSTTYDTWMQGYGERLVEGYSAEGHRVVDAILGPE